MIPGGSYYNYNILIYFNNDNNNNNNNNYYYYYYYYYKWDRKTILQLLLLVKHLSLNKNLFYKFQISPCCRS